LFEFFALKLRNIFMAASHHNISLSHYTAFFTSLRRWHLLTLYLLWFIRPSPAQVSEPVYRIRAEFHVQVAMRDSVRLSCDIFRPDTVGNFPVILMRTPYGNEGSYYREPAKFYAQRGYAVVLQDCRGRYDSEGEFYPEIYEGQDGDDTITWCAAQPWSNRNVGMAGGSYAGAVQWYTAPFANPHLKCIVPEVASSDSYFDGGSMRGGVVQMDDVAWSILISARTNQEPSSETLTKAFWHLPIAEADEAIGYRAPYWKDHFKHPTYDAYWQRTSNRNKYEKIRVPALSISGWYSADDVNGAVTNFVEMRKRGGTAIARENQKLIIGPWPHGQLETSKLGDFDFGPEATLLFRTLDDGTWLSDFVLRWFDYWLKGIDTGIAREPAVKIFVMGDGWRTENEWPLARTIFTKYYLHSDGRANSLAGDGRLSINAPKKQPPDKFTYDSMNPAPSAVGPPDIDLDYPWDQRPIERRDDVLVYSTPPLEEAVEVTGPVRVILYAASSAKDTDFTAKLCDVHPDGRVQPLTWGIVRARYRDSYEQPALLEAGKVYRFEIDLWVTSNLFKKAHRIRVDISSSNFPAFSRNLNTGGDLGWEKEPVIAEQTIYHDAMRPSHLLLPVIPK
jgi:hypothetical protein